MLRRRFGDHALCIWVGPVGFYQLICQVSHSRSLVAPVNDAKQVSILEHLASSELMLCSLAVTTIKVTLHAESSPIELSSYLQGL